MNPKKMPAFGGSFNLKRGMRTIICYVFIKVHNCYKLAASIIFNTKLPVIATFVAEVSGPATACSYAAKPV
jgi:hypothetical protein